LPAGRCCEVSGRGEKTGKDIRSDTSSAEFSVVETVGQLGDRVTGASEEVEEERGSDILASGVLNLLEGGSETVLVGAILSVSHHQRLFA